MSAALVTRPLIRASTRWRSGNADGGTLCNILKLRLKGSQQFHGKQRVASPLFLPFIPVTMVPMVNAEIVRLQQAGYAYMR